jgi:flagellar biosynthesis/type III secretory pathway protein FliH
MPSSNRIIRVAVAAAPAIAATPIVDAPRVTPPVTPGIPTDLVAWAGSAAVLRGRRQATDTRTRGATDGSGELVADLSWTGPERAAEGASRALGVDLLQALRIAEERGYAIGHARGVEELRAATASAAALATKLEAMAPTRTNAVAHAIAEVALAVARRVVGAHLEVDPSILVGVLETAVGKINGSPDARVLLHPDVVDQVRGTWEATHGRSYLGKSWTFESDPALPPGGCMLRYEHGFVDAGLETQLEEIGIALDAAVPGLWHGSSRTPGQSIAELAAPSDPDGHTDPIR